MATKTTGRAKPKAPTKAVAPVAEKPPNLLPHQVLTSTTIQNAASMQAWGKFAGEADLGELVTNLGEEVKTVLDGNMRPAEAMLYGQAMTLQTIFTSLARRAQANDGLKQFQVNMTLALKAQAQCRSTIEALALVKNPMPYIKQANITNGPQQVNNGNASASGHTGISTQGSTHQNTAIADESASGRTGITTQVDSRQKAEFTAMYAQVRTPARGQFSE